MGDGQKQEKMSALRNHGRHARKAERQQHGSFGSVLCAFSSAIVLTDLCTRSDVTLYLDYTPGCPLHASNKLDFGYTSCYMWGVWKEGIGDMHLRKKRRHRVEMLTSRHRLPVAKYCH